ncbi:hypothetical protein V8C35DRAFT_32246 [Trichoderma chlorosporum]
MRRGKVMKKNPILFVYLLVGGIYQPVSSQIAIAYESSFPAQGNAGEHMMSMQSWVYNVTAQHLPRCRAAGPRCVSIDNPTAD